jgi:ribosomal protein L37AE/L43A
LATLRVVADTEAMVDQPGGRGQRDPNVIRLSHQYAACPTCQLILPLYDDPDGAALLPPAQVARCGLCKRPLQAATPWPLDLKLRCPDCGTLVRAPTEAAVLACPGCGSYFANPSNSPEVRQRVRVIVAKQARIAELVNDLDRRLEEAMAEVERQRTALSPLLDVCGHQLADPGGWPGVCMLPAGHPGPHGLPPGSRRPAVASGSGSLRTGSTARGRSQRCSPMPSLPRCRAWARPGSGWWPRFAMPWPAALAAPSGRWARPSTARRRGHASCWGTP